MDVSNLESLGNKAILEKRINIRASDYRFEDKTKYYKGFTSSNGKTKDGTKNYELLSLAESVEDFVESDIISRQNKIVNGFMDYLQQYNLVKQFCRVEYFEIKSVQRVVSCTLFCEFYKERMEVL